LGATLWRFGPASDGAAQGAEQNSVSICIVTLREATFFNRWAGADREKPNQINSMQMGIEELKL
jgi:hypothetical protein